MLSFLAGAVVAKSQTSPDPRLDPDPWQVDVAAYPWSAIGKLNNSVGGSCTAVAIEQDEVLTAAHCIFNPRTRRFLPPSSLHVLFGYRRGDYKLHARVERYTIGPGYEPATRLSSIASDWAVLTLTEPLPEEMRPLQRADRVPVAGTPLMIAGYGRRRLHIMTGDKTCQLLSASQSPDLLVHNCRVAKGLSGAPLLAIESETPVIVGIQVAIGRRNGSAVGLAVALPSIGGTVP